VSLTAGRGPFGRQRHGRFDFDAPDHAVYIEPFPRRVRAVIDGRVVIDSDDVVLVHETGGFGDGVLGGSVCSGTADRWS
jgi:hypothetical protein